MGERRVSAEVVGPGTPGVLKVVLRPTRWPDGFVIDVRAEVLPPGLRVPNSRFVAVVRGREVVRVEPDGSAWLQIQKQIGSVLDHAWDPIGVAGVVPDEYINYIAGVYSLLRSRASDAQIAEHFRRIETEDMGLPGSPSQKLLDVVARLRSLDLPAVATDP